MNRYAHFQYNLQSDTLRILSRRAINRIRSISKIVPYRKAAYANCGLRMATLSYEPVMKLDKKKQSGRLDLALNSIILFTDIAFTVSVYLALLMAIATLAVGLYALAYHFIGNAVEGWTTTILFLSFSFCGLFVILSMVLKYLSLLLQINYMKNTYVFESIESV
jgi:dolichol-phosphate mannosyltransferase